MHCSAQTRPINFRNLNEMPKLGAKCHKLRKCVNRGKQATPPMKVLTYLLNKTLPKLEKGELFREFISLRQCLYCFSAERQVANLEQNG